MTNKKVLLSPARTPPIKAIKEYRYIIVCGTVLMIYAAYDAFPGQNSAVPLSLHYVTRYFFGRSSTLGTFVFIELTSIVLNTL